jgi:hypothetical protein
VDLAVLAKLLLGTQRGDQGVYLLVLLPDRVRVEVYVVVHLLFFRPSSWLYLQGEL